MSPIGEFIPAGPLQPAPGVLWPLEQWISFGADAWDLDTRCVVCGGDLATFDHSRCWPSMDALSPGTLGLGDFWRQLNPVPRNSSVSAESVESTETGERDAPMTDERLTAIRRLAASDRSTVPTNVARQLLREVDRLRAGSTKSLLLLAAALGVALAAGACRAVENVTASHNGFYESPCHPGIFLTAPPPGESPSCKWTFVEHGR